ncbi:general stress protein [Agromyces allii]|uniref:General stress protein 17M-like domain-containing protein n=1 Tax=Agromyces allii TaxID=393607 RepID=A0ABN2QB32_9MICO|nr:general stress protein [Agromyces allii]
MSTPSPFGGRMSRVFPTLPQGETVASFETYAEAQAGVDALAKAEFPLKELAIVGTGLTSVERITGKLTWGRAAGAGALSGAWFGTFLGLLFFIFAPTTSSVGILISAVLIGAGFGMIFSVVSYSVNRRRRDFTSVAQVLATSYSIVAETAHVERARQVLGVTEAPAPAIPTPVSAPAPGVPVATASTPTAPRYGAMAPDATTAAEAPAGEDGADEASAPAVDGAATDAGGEEAAPAETEPAEPQGLTYGEALDAARRKERERRRSGGDA